MYFLTIKELSKSETATFKVQHEHPRDEVWQWAVPGLAVGRFGVWDSWSGCFYDVHSYCISHDGSMGRLYICVERMRPMELQWRTPWDRLRWLLLVTCGWFRLCWLRIPVDLVLTLLIRPHRSQLSRMFYIIRRGNPGFQTTSQNSKPWALELRIPVTDEPMKGTLMKGPWPGEPMAISCVSFVGTEDSGASPDPGASPFPAQRTLHAEWWELFPTFWGGWNPWINYEQALKDLKVSILFFQGELSR